MSETGSSERADGSGRRARPQRRSTSASLRWAAILAAVVVVLVAVGGFLWPGWWQGEAEQHEPQAVPTVVAPVPTPALTPIEPATDTELAAALPTTVLELALTAQESATVPEGALLAYRLTYSDGQQETILDVVQWPSADLAAEHLTQVEGELGEPLREGEVTVGEEVAGRHVVTETDAVWTNGTVVLHLQAPSGAGRIYDAYPL